MDPTCHDKRPLSINMHKQFVAWARCSDTNLTGHAEVRTYFHNAALIVLYNLQYGRSAVAAKAGVFKEVCSKLLICIAIMHFCCAIKMSKYIQCFLLHANRMLNDQCGYGQWLTQFVGPGTLV